MRSDKNRWLQPLLLSGVYLLGALGIMATGGGGGGGGSSNIDSIQLVQPPSPTYSTDTSVTGHLVMDLPSLTEIGDEYDFTVKVEWKNQLTGESGSSNHKFSGECIPNPFWLNLGILIPLCQTFSNESSISITVALAIGTNNIKVKAGPHKTSLQVVRLDDQVPPGIPSGITVLATDGGADVTWDSVPLATSYNIYFASAPGVTKLNYSTLPEGTKLSNVSSPHSISGLNNGTIYYFVVTGVNAFGESAESAETTTTPPTAPSNVQSESKDSSAEISWDPVPGATSYNIYYAASPGVTKSNYSMLPDGNRATGATSPQTITNLTNGTSYYFVVTATNWLGESIESSETTTLPLPANAPHGVKGVTENGQITVTWDSLAFADSYNLYMATESGVNKSNYATLENGQRISGVTSPYVLSGLDNEVRYYLVIEAESTLGEIGESRELVVMAGSSGWAWQNPSPTGNALWAVEFGDSLNGWIVGNGGTILKTSDGGSNWQSQWEQATIDFLSVSVVDQQNVWVMGKKGYITSDVGYFLVNTDDGGNTWSFYAVPSGMVLNDIDFASASTGWIIGSSGIFYTNDGGHSWVLQKNDNNYRGRVIEAIDENNVKVIGDDSSANNMLHSTDDGGQTWSRVASPPGWVYKLHFLDADNGWAANAGIQSTTDGGISWNAQSVPGSPISVSFSDSANGWAVGGDIFHTNDSGTTWTLQLSDTSLSDVFAIDANTAWAVGSGGTILSTDDAGATWVNKNVTSISSLDRLDAIDFVDGSNGWVVGRDSIANTSDAGSTWITQATHNGRNFWGVDFIDVTTGWAVGSQRTLVGTSYIDVAEIFHTSDGGNTWIEQDVGNCGMNCYYRTLYGVSFVDVQTGWAVGSGLFHTIDGGNSWNTQYATVNDLRGVHFLNSSTGWAVGENGTIIHTIDGGVTWNPQASGTSYTLYSVFALDPSTAWIAGGEVNPYRPVILKTSDGGATWQTIDIDNYGRLFSIYFADSLNGWAGGEFGEIFATQDGGNSWIKQSSGFSDGSGRISDIQFINSSTGWATAWFGPTILESISGGFGP